MGSDPNIRIFKIFFSFTEKKKLFFFTMGRDQPRSEFDVFQVHICMGPKPHAKSSGTLAVNFWPMWAHGDVRWASRPGVIRGSISP